MADGNESVSISSHSCEHRSSVLLSRKQKKALRLRKRHESYKQRLNGKLSLEYTFYNDVNYTGVNFGCPEVEDIDVNTGLQAYDDHVYQDLIVPREMEKAFLYAAEYDDCVCTKSQVRSKRTKGYPVARKSMTRQAILTRKVRAQLKSVCDDEVCMDVSTVLPMLISKKSDNEVKSHLVGKLCKTQLNILLHCRDRKRNIEKMLTLRGVHRGATTVAQSARAQKEIAEEKYVLNEASSTLAVSKTTVNALVRIQYRDITPNDYEILLQLEDVLKPQTLDTHQIAAIDTVQLSNEETLDPSKENAVEKMQYRDITPNDYEMLLQLEDVVKPSTISTHQIASMETIYSSNEKIADPCSICFDNFVPQDRVKVLPKCKHMFHENCITVWLSTCSDKCPLDSIKV